LGKKNAIIIVAYTIIKIEDHVTSFLVCNSGYVQIQKKRRLKINKNNDFKVSQRKDEQLLCICGENASRDASR
jgi:hypothetical protein